MVMRVPLKERLLLSSVVLVLVAVLVGLAVLQYRWSREVSDATTARLKANLQTSMLAWRDDLYQELTGALAAMQAAPSGAAGDRLEEVARQYENWSRGAQHAGLVSNVFLYQNAGTAKARLLQLNRATGQFEPVVWPFALEPLRDGMERASSGMLAAAARGGAPHALQPGRPADAEQGHRHHMPNMPFQNVMIDLNALTLVRAPLRHDLREAVPMNWLMVQLDPKVMREHIFPELADRHFSNGQGLEFQVAVVAAQRQAPVYTSDAGFSGKEANTDGAVAVFGPPFGMPHRAVGAFAGPPPVLHRGPGAPRDHNDFGPNAQLRVEPVHFGMDQPEWQLVVRHRKGSLDAVVAGMRRRSLAISFGVLLVLAAGMGMIIVTSQRARVLARLQMDFVAAVSHELRTPLAVISSAADNISHGVVEGKQQLSQYGAVIKNQSRQLTNLVEQILLFAATRDGRHRYNLHPLNVAEVIESALNNTSSVIQSAGVTVEKAIQPGLPQVMGDASALSHCLQNLITNAVKYGGEARWMRIAAASGGNEVTITVEDKGIGITPSELSHVFEPFYRSPSVASAQIHGTGLGLPLAKNIAEALGGKFTVSSEPGKGTAFTLHLPSASVAQTEQNLKAGVLAKPKFS